MTLAILFGAVGMNTVMAQGGTKTPLLLLKNGEINSTDFDITPVEPSSLTTDKLYAATFKSKNDNPSNTFQYKGLNVKDYDKIVIKYTIEEGNGDWQINLPNGTFTALPVGSNKEYVIQLKDVDTYGDFTIFSWFHVGQAITISEVYLYKAPDPDCSVIYEVKDAGGNIIFTSEPQGTTSGTRITELPNEFKRAFCEYTTTDVTLEKDKETTVEFTATWDACPITFYADYTSIVWKNLHLSRSKQWYLNNNDPTPSLVGDPSDKDRTADSYQWGFVGNPYQYKIYNKAAGSTKTLNGSAVMAEGETIWTSVAKNGEKGILFGRASDGQFLNQAGGDGNTALGFWWNPTDEGSTFYVADVPEPSLIIGEAGWATFGSLDKSANLNAATNVYAAKYENGSVKLTAVESKSVPAGVGVLVKGQGKISLAFDVDASAVESDLKVSDGTVTGDGSTIYVLAKEDAHGVGFYKLAEGTKVPAGKAYLVVPAGSAREFIGFGDATAIKSVETVKANGAVYNLAGQEVKSAQKGVFIINGKKVIK